MPPKTKADMKKAEQDRLQALVVDLLRDEENKYCADCEGKQPRWASWNLGIFICIRCAGIHRNLGVHISKVKSVTLDSWTPEQVQSMRTMGNGKAKTVYEADLPEHFRRPQSDQSMESFIRAKYEHKRYQLKDWIPPKIDISSLPKHGEKIDRPTPKISMSPRGSTTTSSNASKAIPSTTNKTAELLDLSAPTPTTNVSLSTTSGSLLDFNDPAPSQSASMSSQPADLDDLFGPIVSVPPVSSNPSTTSPQSQPQTPQQPVEPSVSGVANDLSGISLGCGNSDGKKSNTDIMALFGNIPAAATRQQFPVPQQQPHQFQMQQQMAQQFNQQQQMLQQQKAHQAYIAQQSQLAQQTMAARRPSNGFADFANPMAQANNQVNMASPMNYMSGVITSPSTAVPFAAFGMNSFVTVPASTQPPVPNGNVLAGLSAPAFQNTDTAAAFAAASPFASAGSLGMQGLFTNASPHPPMPGPGYNNFNLDQLL